MSSRKLIFIRHTIENPEKRSLNPRGSELDVKSFRQTDLDERGNFYRLLVISHGDDIYTISRLEMS